MSVGDTGRSPTRKELGAGLSFPLRLDERGRFAMSAGPRKVQESVRIVIETAIGSRLMRSQFGSQVAELLFEPLTPGSVGRLREAISTSLQRWEPRIDVLDVSVARDPDVETKLIASVDYRIRENNSLLNQVFDFYLEEGAEEF